MTAPSSLLSLWTVTEQRPAAIGGHRVSAGWCRAAGLPEAPLFPGGGWGLPGSVSPEGCNQVLLRRRVVSGEQLPGLRGGGGCAATLLWRPGGSGVGSGQEES